MYDFEEVIVFVDCVFVLIVCFVMFKCVYEIDLLCLCVMLEVCYDVCFIEIFKDIWYDLCEEV